MASINILTPNHSGKIEITSAAVFPSVPSPYIAITSLLIKNIRESEAPNSWSWSYAYDIEVEGIVECGVCDLIAGIQGAISKGVFTFNNSGKADAEFEIEVTKDDSTDPARPFPYSGKFRTEIKDLPMMIGNNLFQFTIESPIYFLEGFTKWVVVFNKSDQVASNGMTEVEESTHEMPTPNEPRCVCAAGRGELYPFYLAINDGPNAANFVANQGSFTNSQHSELNELPLLSVAGKPAVFVLRPSCKTLEFDIELSKLKLESEEAPTELKFMHAFLRGLLATGAELVCLTDASVIELQTTELAFIYKWLNHKNEEATISLWSQCVNQLEEDSIPCLFEKLYEAAKNPEFADDFSTAIILWDLERIGIEAPPRGDWRSLILDTLSTYLDCFFRKYLNNDEPELAYVLGRYVGETLRRNLRPSYPVQRQDHGLIEFCSDLIDDPFFAENGLGYCARNLLESGIRRMRDARKWAGKE